MVSRPYHPQPKEHKSRAAEERLQAREEESPLALRLRFRYRRLPEKAAPATRGAIQ